MIHFVATFILLLICLSPNNLVVAQQPSENQFGGGRLDEFEAHVVAIEQYEGLSLTLGGRLHKAIRNCTVFGMPSAVDAMYQLVKVDPQDLIELEKLHDVRVTGQKQRLARWCKQLVAEKKLTELDILRAIQKIKEEEMVDELKMTEQMEKILDPEQQKILVRELCKQRSRTARLPLVSRYLGLTQAQIEHYNRLREFEEKMMSINSKPGDETERELLRLVEKADASLNAEQLTIVFQAIEIAKIDESLEECYLRQSVVAQNALRRGFPVVAKLHATLEQNTPRTNK